MLDSALSKAGLNPMPWRRSPEGVIADVLPGQDSGFNARTRVHEYGGGESVIADGVVYWSNFKYVWR